MHDPEDPTTPEELRRESVELMAFLLHQQECTGRWHNMPLTWAQSTKTCRDDWRHQAQDFMSETMGDRPGYYGQLEFYSPYSDRYLLATGEKVTKEQFDAIKEGGKA